MANTLGSYKTIALVVLAVMVAQSSSVAHEYWIEPTDFAPNVLEQSTADLKVGSDLKGQPLSYVPQFTVSYQITDQFGSRDLTGNAGDRPALAFTPDNDGLNIITYQTTKNRVTFAEWEKFNTYLITQGMQDIAERHRSRELLDKDFSESYSRYAKTLLDVGGTTMGQDKQTGMPIELVALQNPYALAPGQDLSVQLFYLNQPLSDHQISIFVQDVDKEDELEISRVRTDQSGQISLSLQRDKMYLLNAINMVDVEGDGKVVWESFWGSLTFALPQ